MCVLDFVLTLAKIIISKAEKVNLAESRRTYFMSKKIVVITGSPRKNGNSFAITDTFIKAAEAKGHTVTRFDAALKKVGGCRACETCFSTGKACTFDDDFNTIAPAILEADVIVFTIHKSITQINAATKTSPYCRAAVKESRCHRNRKSRKNIVFMQLYVVFGIHFLQCGEQMSR